jgi:hypothetical protein
MPSIVIKLLVIFVIIDTIIGIVIVLAARKPNEFRVQRSASIHAAPEKVFSILNDFHKWGAWSPWEKMDPEMVKTYSGPASGKGSGTAWDSKKVGKGSMEIMESTPSSKLVIALNFEAPMKANNTAEFTLASAGGGTEVTWAMYGKANLMSKIFQLFCSMDKMVGKDFEAGLSNLKALAEK